MDLGGSQQTDKHLFDGGAAGAHVGAPLRCRAELQQFDKHLFDGSAKGERIATPVCALVRNDRLDTADDRPINIY